MDLTQLARSGGPVLFWRGPDHDTLDLTGPVIANWVNKGVGLFGDFDLGPDFTLWVPMPIGLHWREVVAILSVVLAGGRVELGPLDEAASVPEDDFHVLVPLGHEHTEALSDAEEIFVYNPPALALRTPVEHDFIDINSAIRAYPDVTRRRLAGSGSLHLGGRDLDWTAQATAEAAGAPTGILVSRAAPGPDEWGTFLGHLLGGGETLLATGMDVNRITDLAAALGEVRGRLGTWTK